MTPIERLLAKLPDAKQAGKGWSARCPAHEDRRASLSIAEGAGGRALVKCHAGCKADAICAALGLRVLDLMPTADTLPKPNKTQPNGKRKPADSADGKPRMVADYVYRDEAGELLFQVVRMEPKDFRQRRPKAGGGWEWSVKGVRAVPYRLPELVAEPTRPVVVVEGEKDADNLANLGVLATCNAGGAGKWTGAHAEFLRGRHVVVLTDNDEPGRDHARQVAQSLAGIAASVRIVELPGLPPKGDVSDWLTAGGTKAELKRLADGSPEWTPTAAQPWPEIVSFDELDLPEFPTHALPEALREWVEGESHATQTPADLAGLLALAVCSAAIARRVVVEPRPGLARAGKFVRSRAVGTGQPQECRLRGRHAAVARTRSGVDRNRAADRGPRSVRPTPIRGPAAQARKARRGARRRRSAARSRQALRSGLAEQPEPVLPRLIVDDATSEKLGMMLADHGGRIASMSPEGGVFDLMAGLYSKSGIPQFGVYLMGHSGR